MHGIGSVGTAFVCCKARSAGLGLVVVAACLHLHLRPSVHRSYPVLHSPIPHNTPLYSPYIPNS